MIEIAYSQFSTLNLSESDLVELLGSAMGCDFENNVVVTGASDGDYDFSDQGSSVPELTPATMDIASMLAALEMLADAVHGQQMELSSSRLQDSTQERKDYNTRMLDAMRTASEKMREVQSTQAKKHRIEVIKAAFNVIASSLMLLASIVATPLTGGVAAACVAAAAVGLVLAVLDLGTACCANAGIQATNADGSKRAMDVTLGGLVTAVTEHMRSNGKLQFLSDSELKKWEMAWGTALSIIVVVAMVATSGKGAVEVGRLAKAAEGGEAQAMEQLESFSAKGDYVIRLANVMAQMGESSAGIVDGRLTLRQGQEQADASEATALKEFLTALAEVAATQSKAIVDVITQSIKNLDDHRTAVLTMLQLMTHTPASHTFM